MKGSFADARVEELAPWLAGPNGIGFTRGLGVGEDREVRLLEGAMLQWSPYTCGDDALDLLGTWFGLPRYPEEPNGIAPATPGAKGTGYRGRLCNAWEAWIWAGTKRAIVEQIGVAFGCSVEVFADDEGAFWGPSVCYSRFRVRIGTKLGSLTTTSFVIGEGIIGSTPIGGPHLSATQRQTMKNIILRWKGAHGYAVDILIWISGGPPIGEGEIGHMVIGGESEQIWIGRLIGKNVTIGSTPIGGYDRS